MPVDSGKCILQLLIRDILPMRRPSILALLVPALAATACLRTPSTPSYPPHRTNSTSLAESRPPIIPQSWTQPAWYIDPLNSTGVASDSNSCATILLPCLTYAEVAARWGTYSPRLRQNTLIDFLSNDDGTDPFYFNPYVENQAIITVKAELPTPVQTTTITVNQAKSRSANHLLEVTFATSTGITGNQYVVDTTRNSSAWTFNSLGAGEFQMSQPLLASNSNEDDGWTNGDTVSIYQLTKIQASTILPVLEQYNSGGSIQATVNVVNLQLGETGQSGNLQINSNEVNVFGSLIDNNLVPFNRDVFQQFVNCAVYDSRGQSILLNAGLIFVNPSYLYVPAISAYNDAILNAGATLISGNASNNWGPTPGAVGSIFGNVYIVNQVQISSALTIFSPSTQLGSVWGPGTLVLSNGRFSYPSGAGAAAATFLNSGGLKISTSTAACSTSQAATDVVSCGISLTPANLDTANSGVSTGFGGYAFLPGIGAITNF
jgi:hypothetical protein